METFIVRLRDEIRKGLPGRNCQWEMASADRFVKNFTEFPGKDAHEAAVLLLLYPNKNSIYTLLIQRPDYEGIHGGQISFPGGKMEAEDKDIVQTALRETEEETGISRSLINVIEPLTSLFIPVSNMNVTPVTAWCGVKPVFNYHKREVAYLIEVDLRKLLDPSIIRTRPATINGISLEIRYFDYNNHMIWGATAMILNELLELIRKGALFGQG